MPTFEEISVDLIHLSQNCPFVPAATSQDAIYNAFEGSPQVPPDLADEGMWSVVNNKMDSYFGDDVIETHLRTGPHGLKRVLQWLSDARKHPTWQHDDILLIKLLKIRSKLIGV